MDNTLGKPEIKRDDPEIRERWNGIQDRRRELSARLAVVNGKIDELVTNLGAFVAEPDCDYRIYTDQLFELENEQKALNAGITYLSNQAEGLRRVNTWL